MLCKLKVHFINRAITGHLMSTFRSVRRLRRTSFRSLATISRVNRQVTQDVVTCFTSRHGEALIGHLGRCKLRVSITRRGLTGHSRGLGNLDVIVDKAFTGRSHSRCGTVVRRRNKGGDNSISNGASCVLTKSGVKPTGLRGTTGLNIGVVGRSRFLGVVTR